MGLITLVYLYWWMRDWLYLGWLWTSNYNVINNNNIVIIIVIIAVIVVDIPQFLISGFSFTTTTTPFHHSHLELLINLSNTIYGEGWMSMRIQYKGIWSILETLDLLLWLIYMYYTVVMVNGDGCAMGFGDRWATTRSSSLSQVVANRHHYRHCRFPVITSWRYSIIILTPFGCWCVWGKRLWEVGD